MQPISRVKTEGFANIMKVAMSYAKKGNQAS